MAKKIKRIAKDQDLRDVIQEAENPGRTHKKILSVERRRKFLEAAKMLADPNSSLREYMDAIREIEPQEDSQEFLDAVKLWHKFHASA